MAACVSQGGREGVRQKEKEREKERRQKTKKKREEMIEIEREKQKELNEKTSIENGCSCRIKRI